MIKPIVRHVEHIVILNAKCDQTELNLFHDVNEKLQSFVE